MSKDSHAEFRRLTRFKEITLGACIHGSLCFSCMSPDRSIKRARPHVNLHSPASLHRALTSQLYYSLCNQEPKKQCVFQGRILENPRQHLEVRRPSVCGVQKCKYSCVCASGCGMCTHAHGHRCECVRYTSGHVCLWTRTCADVYGHPRTRMRVYLHVYVYVLVLWVQLCMPHMHMLAHEVAGVNHRHV